MVATAVGRRFFLSFHIGRAHEWNATRRLALAVLLMSLAATSVHAAGGSQWVSAWTVAHGDRLTTPAMSGSSVRMIVRPTVSGSAVRVEIENALGQSPVVFSSAYIGQVQSGAALVPGSNTQLRFNGQAGLTLAGGAGAYSDPVAFPVAAFGLYAVSLDVTSASDISAHMLGLTTNYMATGAHAADSGANAFAAIPNGDRGTGEGPTFPFYWVADLDVQSSSTTGSIVILGDSISDGECSTRSNNGASSGVVTPDEYNRWTDLLAGRLSVLPSSQAKAIADEGIAGNRLVSGGGSPPGLSRLNSDVLGRSGVKVVVLFEGTNDIANGATAATVIAADQQVINSVHAAGLQIAGATIIPRGGDASGPAPWSSSGWR
jgi:GDSL-like Lipase/Acylhydrolase family